MTWSDSPPRVSIVVAVLNRGVTLERCLESVEAQTWPHRELLVVDGGSTDRTQDVLRAHAGSITWSVSEPDHGVYQAWNKALPHVGGEWVYFLGADDRLSDPGVLERLAPVLSAALPTCRIVYGQVDVVSPEGAFVETLNRPWPKTRRAFRHHMAICHQGVFHHRSVFEAHGSFDESFRVAGDYELLLRVLLHEDPLYTPEVVATMQMGGLSTSFRDSLETAREIERARHANGLTARSWRNTWELALLMLRRALAPVLGEAAANAASDLYRLIRGKPRRWTR